MTIGILVVDDHPIVFAGLAAEVRRRKDLTIVGRAPSLAVARQQIADPRVDVVLLDLRLPDGSGFELLAEAASIDDSPAIILYSGFFSAQYLSVATALGAAAFVIKTSPMADVIDAIIRAASGELTSPQSTDGGGHVSRALSRQEHEVIAGVMAGGSNDEIGRDMSLARKTVEAYLGRLFIRFKVSSRTELGVLAEQGHLLDLPLRQTLEMITKTVDKDRGDHPAEYQEA